MMLHMRHWVLLLLLLCLGGQRPCRVMLLVVLLLIMGSLMLCSRKGAEGRRCRPGACTLGDCTVLVHRAACRRIQVHGHRALPRLPMRQLHGLRVLLGIGVWLVVLLWLLPVVRLLHSMHVHVMMLLVLLHWGLLLRCLGCKQLQLLRRLCMRVMRDAPCTCASCTLTTCRLGCLNGRGPELGGFDAPGRGPKLLLQDQHNLLEGGPLRGLLHVRMCKHFHAQECQRVSIAG